MSNDQQKFTGSLDPEESANSPILVENKNPFKIDLIRRKIFCKLSVFDLARCRLVSPEWNSIFTPHFLNAVGQIQITFSSGDDKEGGSIGEFLETMRKSSIYFTNFSFMNLNLNSETVKTLLKENGNYVTELNLNYTKQKWGKSSLSSDADTNSENSWRTIDSDSDESSEDEDDNQPKITLELFEKLLSDQCPNLANLDVTSLPENVKEYPIFGGEEPRRKLSIKTISLFHEYRTSDYKQKFLHSLFNVCPLLENIQMDANCDSFLQDLKMLKALIKTDRIKSLKEMKVNSYTKETLSLLNGALENSKPCLKKLRVSSLQSSDMFREGAAAVPSNVFQSFLNILSSTIVELSVNVDDKFSFPPPINFPIMMHLEVLILKLSLDPNVQYFGQISWATHFPKLKTLHLSARQCSGNRLNITNLFSLAKNSKPQNLITDISLPGGINNPYLIADIAKILPNVLKLHMEAQTDETLQAIWTSWPNLEELFLCVYEKTQVQPSLSLDSLFTGIPVDVCKTIREKKNFVTVDVNRYRESPSLANLKSLKRLLVHAGPKRGTYEGHLHRGPDDRISDVTGYFAFGKLTSLTFVHISPELVDLSDHCLNEICEKLGLFYGKALLGTVLSRSEEDLRTQNVLYNRNNDELCAIC